MNDEETGNVRQNNWLWAAMGLVGLVILAILILVQTPSGARTGLKPRRPTPTPIPLEIDSQPVLVTFGQLNEDPLSLLNRRIRVTGNFQRVTPPACRPRNGPDVRWSLVADDLQLDALGFEAIVRLVPSGLSMTVEGNWRRYRGPLGCGKEPPTGDAWVLEVARILEPNPLPLLNGLFAAGSLEVVPFSQEGSGVFALPPGPAAGGATPTPTAGAPGTVTATPSATPTPAVTVSVTPTLDGTPSATPTPTSTPTGTASPGAGTPSAATPTGSPTPTGTPDGGATPTGQPPPPPPATPTLPGGYQGGGGLPTSTPYP